MILLKGADLVLPDRILTGGTLVLEDGRIAEFGPAAQHAGAHANGLAFDLSNHYIVPGFIDVHVHGIEGTDALDGGAAIKSCAKGFSVWNAAKGTC